MPALRVTLPVGLWHGDALHREVELRPPDEAALLADAGDAALPARRVSALLDGCVVVPGAEDAFPGGVGRALAAGDREALLLHLRRALEGDRIDAVVDCPAEACGEPMELRLGVGGLLLPPDPAPRPRHALTLGEGVDALRLEVRLPTGADLEDAAQAARRDPAAGARLLLSRCVLAAHGDAGGMEVDALPDGVLDAAAGALAGLDPQAELVLELVCPACGRGFTSVFDTAAFLFREMEARRTRLMHEVHVLALRYHWSERDILALGPRRRRVYLELLDRAGYAEVPA